jgi:Uma2 family endonuclease
MPVVTGVKELSPEEVERASERDDRRYELVDGELREKKVGAKALFVATRICELLNGKFYPQYAFAAVEIMIYCFARKRHGRKPDVVFVRLDRLSGGEIPDGDLFIAPDMVVEVLSPGNTSMELDEKLNEYLAAGVPLVWIVNPETQTIRAFRNDGTTQLHGLTDVIENEPLLPGFRLVVKDIFPVVKG